jgi:TrmH family RNA methyltransferase
VITSVSNQLVKMACSLRHKKGRREQNLYSAEGIHLVTEAVKAGVAIRQFFWSEKLLSTGEGSDLLQLLTGKYPGIELSQPVMEKVCETESPQGIVALLTLPPEEPLDLSGVKLGLIIDGLQDPGNVGTIIRTAWAGGVDCLILTANTVDPYQGKAVRASMGGIFHQKIFRNISPAWIMEAAAKAGQQIVAGVPGAPRSYFSVDLNPPTLLLLGNEGRGITAEWEKYDLVNVYIPQPGNAESLNVSVAAGILMYEVIRQRLGKSAFPAMLR